MACQLTKLSGWLSRSLSRDIVHQTAAGVDTVATQPGAIGASLRRPILQKSQCQPILCSNKRYLEIMRHYDACLQQHGDTARGTD
jgi:hypothetical protein